MSKIYLYKGKKYSENVTDDIDGDLEDLFDLLVEDKDTQLEAVQGVVCYTLGGDFYCSSDDVDYEKTIQDILLYGFSDDLEEELL